MSLSSFSLYFLGKAAIVEIETTSYADGSEEPLCMNRLVFFELLDQILFYVSDKGCNLLLRRTTIYLRGAGGFSKSSPPYSFASYSGHQTPSLKIPKTQPFASYEDITRPSQVYVIIVLILHQVE